MIRKLALLNAVVILALVAVPVTASAVIPDKPVFGDWDGNNTTTIGVFRSAKPSGGEDTWYLRNENKAGEPQITVNYGGYGDKPVFGDWDGNNTTTIGVYRLSPKGEASTWYLRNKNTGGEPEITISYGGKTDVPVFGDWDGNNTTTIGVYRPPANKGETGVWYLRNKNEGGEPEETIKFGEYGEVPVFGDWNGDNITDIGMFKPSPEFGVDARWLIPGEFGFEAGYGGLNEEAVFGDWNGNNTTTIGVYKPSTGVGSGVWKLRNVNEAGLPEIEITYGGYQE